MFEGMDPKTLMKWLIVAAVVYFVVPYDLIPDYFGLAGRIDDVVTIALLAWFYRSYLQRYVAAASARDAAAGSGNAGAGRGSPAQPKQAKAFDAYEVLGISRSASSEAIVSAYRDRMKEYHPDKVAHLGEELQQLAHEKSQQIQRAYKQLRS